jgi:hypothetical protein
MKSFEKLGKAAYLAYWEAISFRDRETLLPDSWEDMHPESKECWVAVAKQIVAELAALN